MKSVAGKGRAVAVLLALASAASCQGGGVFSYQGSRILSALASGEVSVLSGAAEKDIVAAADRIGEGGAYVLSRHARLANFSREALIPLVADLEKPPMKNEAGSFREIVESREIQEAVSIATGEGETLSADLRMRLGKALVSRGVSVARGRLLILEAGVEAAGAEVVGAEMSGAASSGTRYNDDKRELEQAALALAVARSGFAASEGAVRDRFAAWIALFDPEFGASKVDIKKLISATDDAETLAILARAFTRFGRASSGNDAADSETSVDGTIDSRWGEGAAAILRARNAVARKEYERAYMYTTALALPGTRAEGDISLFARPDLLSRALVSDMGKALYYGGQSAVAALPAPAREKAWKKSAAALHGVSGAIAEAAGGLAAGKDAAKSEARATALYWESRCLLKAGDLAGAIAVLDAATVFAPMGRTRDSILWQRCDVAGEAAAGTASEKRSARITALAKAFPLAHDPEFFSDLIVALQVECLSENDDGAFSDLVAALLPSPPPSRARSLRYTLKRLSEMRGHARPGKDGVPSKPRTSLDVFIAESGLKGRGYLDYYLLMEDADSGIDPFLGLEPGKAAAAPKEMPTLGSSVDTGPATAFVDILFSAGLYDDIVRFVGEHRAKRTVAVKDAAVMPLPAAFCRFWGDKLGDAKRPIQAARLYQRMMASPDYAPASGDSERLYPRTYLSIVREESERYDVDPWLLMALMRTESSFDPRVVSRTGALGLSQLMPATARGIFSGMKADESVGLVKVADADASREGVVGGWDLFDPRTNLRAGAKYLAQLTRYFGGDVFKAVLAYNGGMGRVKKWASGATASGASASGSLPPDLFIESVPIGETREYGKKVLAAYAAYGYLYGDRKLSGSRDLFFAKKE